MSYKPQKSYYLNGMHFIIRRTLSLFIFVIFVVQVYSQKKLSDTFTFSTHDNLTFVDTILINNKVIINRFIYDTGSELSVIDSKFINKINHNEANKDIVVKDILGHRKRQKTVIIDSIKLGNNTYYNIKAFIVDLSNLNIDGIIGCNVLKNHIWKFDYPNHLITRYSSISDLPTTPKYTIPFSFKNGIPRINIRIGSHTIDNIIFDTGNANPLSFAVKDTSLLLTESIKDTYIRYYAYSINSDQKTLSRIKESAFTKLQCGDYTMDTTTAVFLGYAPAIGTPMLYHSNVVIDFPSKQIYIDKIARDKYATLGCQFEITQSGDIKVSSLTEGSAADNAGIKLDDILVSWKGYEDINAIRQAVSNSSIHKYKDKTVILRMEGWNTEKTIKIQ